MSGPPAHHLAPFEKAEFTMSSSDLRDDIRSELHHPRNDEGSVDVDHPVDMEREGPTPTYSSNEFFKGERVTIRGLQSKPHLNGTVGTVEKPVAARGRYAVKLDSGGVAILLKAQNLSLEADATGHGESDQPSRPPGGHVIDARVHGPYGFLLEEKQRLETLVRWSPEADFGLEPHLEAAEPGPTDPISDPISSARAHAIESPHEASGIETARTAPEHDSAVERPFAKYEVLFGPVRVHEAPSLHSDVLDFRRQGEVLDVDLRQDGWVRLSGTDYFGGKRGWLLISGDQIGLGLLLKELCPPRFVLAQFSDARLTSPPCRAYGSGEEWRNSAGGGGVAT